MAFADDAPPHLGEPKQMKYRQHKAAQGERQRDWSASKCMQPDDKPKAHQRDRIANAGHMSSRPDGSIVSQDGYNSGAKNAATPISATAQS
jgi:hypothetical protein